MLSFIMISLLVLAHRSLGSDDLQKLLKKHPTWSFELVSVETMIKEAVDSLKAFDLKLTEEELRTKIKNNVGPETTHIVRKIGDPKWSKRVPSTFDAREKWKACASLINEVDDEGTCHSEGPVVAASVATDRYCIYMNGTFTEKLSAEMLAGCAEYCTQKTSFRKSFKYIAKHGIPTGGNYKSNKGCLPYPLTPCNHTVADYWGDVRDETWGSRSHLAKLIPCEKKMSYDHDCPTECSNNKYGKFLQDDLKQFTTWYYVFGNEFHVRSEILTYGPLATSIQLWDDFFQYPQGGMYKKKDKAKFVTWDKYFKLIGWGEEDGTKYWLAINTWDSWGNTKVFKVPRGLNYLDVEDFLYGGVFEDLHKN